MVEVAGAVGSSSSVGLMSREREGRDGTAVTAAGVRSNPRRTVLQAIDILLGKRMALPIDLAHGWPGVVELISGREVSADGNESGNEGGEDNNTEEGERGRVGDHSNEETWEIGPCENTYAYRKGQKSKKNKTKAYQQR